MLLCLNFEGVNLCFCNECFFFLFCFVLMICSSRNLCDSSCYDLTVLLQDHVSLSKRY
jgi:hypothetical protein